ncbi:metalloregulator ArsR/SmtB family transcription factor [Patulibacter sp. NPDC049589]|uniref:ArsR/SmtB family transcription factor n=1 Tax=Patulibacter sp. NPDC049589 TaxID=3154731 RepID=UPI00343AC70C
MSDACDLLCLDLEKAEGLRHGRLEQAAAEQLALGAAALGDPTRVMLAMALRGGGELCVCDLSWIVERPEKVVSHHVRKMRTAGVLHSRRDGRMVMYALTPAGDRLLDALVSREVTA